MSTLSTANLLPSWKDEVKDRVADHRRGKSAPLPEIAATPHAAQTGRAARAAARVTARYSNAPSYSQMLAEEIRAAMRAAEAAHEAAEDAHAAVQMVLAGIEAASTSELPTEQANEMHIVPERVTSAERGTSARRAASTEQAAVAAPSAMESLHETMVPVASGEMNRQSEPDLFSDPFVEMRLAPQDADAHGRHAAGFAQADPAEEPQPIAANLIQFPREVVATRRLRPRRIEGPLAALETAPQLSIFEVDAAFVSTQPTAPAADEQAAPGWMQPGWATVEPEPRAQEELRQEQAATHAASKIVDLAAVDRRAMAIMIDGALTLTGFAGLVWLTAASGLLVHSARAFEFVAAVLLLLVCAGYQALFSALTKSTPGMWYAGIGLCTTDGYVPNRAQYWRRLAALPLSVMPLGLGLAWSLFDEDQLTWHDRLSGTYLRLR
jgi:uncharacterized RDD family membrane protein YckC